MGSSVLLILAGLVFLFLSGREIVSAPSGVRRGWMEEEWKLLTDPPRFPPSAASRTIDTDDIRLTTGKTAGGYSSEVLTIEVSHGGKLPGDEEFHLSVHDVFESDSPSSVTLPGSGIRVSLVGLSGWKSSTESFRKIYRMPGWKEVESPANSDDKKIQLLLQRLDYPEKKDWTVRCEIIVEMEGDVLRFHKPGLVDTDHQIPAGAIRNWGSIGKQGFSTLQFDLFSRFPASLALIMDVYHDCERGIPLPASAGEIVSRNGYEIETLVRNSVAYSIPLTDNRYGISTFRHVDTGPLTTKQEFAGKPAEGDRESVFLNVRPFIRQDAILLTEDLVKNGRTRWNRQIHYPPGAPSTAPFGFFGIKNDPDCSVHVSIAKRIDRTIVRLGRLPFKKWSGPVPEDLLDVHLSHLEIDGPYNLERAIGLPAGLKVEIDGVSLEDELSGMPNRTFTDTSPREILKFARAYLGTPSFDEEEGVVVFEDHPSPFVEELKEWLEKFR